MGSFDTRKMENKYKRLLLIVFCEYTLFALYLDTFNPYLIPTIVYAGVLGLIELKEFTQD